MSGTLRHMSFQFSCIFAKKNKFPSWSRRTATFFFHVGARGMAGLNWRNTEIVLEH